MFMNQSAVQKQFICLRCSVQICINLYFPFADGSIAWYWRAAELAKCAPNSVSIAYELMQKLLRHAALAMGSRLSLQGRNSAGTGSPVMLTDWHATEYHTIQPMRVDHLRNDHKQDGHPHTHDWHTPCWTMRICTLACSARFVLFGQSLPFVHYRYITFSTFSFCLCLIPGGQQCSCKFN